MMKGRLIIDDKDAYGTWGVYVKYGGLCGLLSYPTLKPITTNDWHEYDGVEADLSSLLIDGRRFQMTFHITYVRDAEDFFYMLSESVYHTFQFPHLGREYTLRLVSNGAFSQFYNTGYGSLTLTFAEDMPAIPTIDSWAPSVPLVKEQGYAIDGTSLAAYGVLILTGTDATLRKAADVKENLSVSDPTSKGIVYDNGEVHYKVKDVNLYALIHTPTHALFKERYYSLFSTLTTAGEHLLTVAHMDQSFRFWYKSGTVTEFLLRDGGDTWCEFTLTLTVNGWRPVETWMLLQAEAGDTFAEDNDIPLATRKLLTI